MLSNIVKRILFVLFNIIIQILAVLFKIIIRILVVLFIIIIRILVVLYKIIVPILESRGYRNPFITYPEEEFQVDDELYMSVVEHYVVTLSTICDFHELPLVKRTPRWRKHEIGAYFKQLEPIFKLSRPRLNSRINKCHLVEAFLSLLLQLLYHKTDRIVGPFRDRIDILEKELRFLRTILGDLSWMLCHSGEHDAEFQNLLPQLEVVADQAGGFLHYLFFSGDQGVAEKDKHLTALLDQIHLMKAKLQLSINAAAAYTTTPTATSVVDSIVILNSLVDDLEDLLKREDDPVADLKEQVNLLHHELLLSHSSIKDMISHPQPSEIGEVKEALMHIGCIAHQVEYLITSFLVKDAPLCYVFNRLTHLNRRIEPIRTELQLITQKYKFRSLKVAEYCSSEEPLQDKRYTEVNDVTVGFEDEIEVILGQLVGGPGSESLQIISILGMAGLGKTTLSKKLYNHSLVKYTFDKLAWCVVSETYERKTILANILIHVNCELGKDDILNMEEISLLEHVHKTLMGRRYLIALDDIWSSNALDELLRCFPHNGNGSRILFTSRIKDVAPSNVIMHELPFLTGEQCWELLQKKRFGSRDCPLQLQGIGKKIAARCYGLPLMVIVIASVLSTMDEDEGTWEKVGGSLASYTDNSVMQILELSYKHLPDHLKPCFLYFGEYREDEEISVADLKRLWVAEGFIPREKDKSAENIAENYLMELIDKSLVMVGKRSKDGRGVKSCIVHDLLRDLCLRKCKEESFLKHVNNIYLHNLFVKDNHSRTVGNTSSFSCYQHGLSFVGDCPYGLLFVRDMRLLRVLSFSPYCIRPRFGIEYLLNLKFLIIGDLPTWIDRLVNLEYLRVKPMGNVYLPPTIVKMKKLRYISAELVKYEGNWNISNQTNSLEYLSKVFIENSKDEELLKCSPHPRELKCRYRYDSGEEPHFDLPFLTQLHSFSLHGTLSKGVSGFPSNIRKLTLEGSRLPWEKMSIVGRLKFLEVLKLSVDAFVGETWDTEAGEFQELRFLQLERIRLSEWNVASNEHFPKLQQLILIGCHKLQELPGEITTLELIEVHWGCPSSLAESAERIKQEQRDMGNDDLVVVIRSRLDEVYENTCKYVTCPLNDLFSAGYSLFKEIAVKVYGIVILFM